MDWRERELNRFKSGEYRRLAWDSRLPIIDDHFAHISRKDPRLVAYTQCQEKGERDIQTPMKPGRYLRQYYPDLDDNQVNELTALHRVKLTQVSFAATESEVVRVFERRDGGEPISCMGHLTSYYRSHIHPAAVYGDSDLQVAYIGPIDRCTARVVVYPAAKVWAPHYTGSKGGFYGDSAVLRQMLEEQGYRLGDVTDFEDARIRAIKCGDTFVIPFLDYTDRVSLDPHGNWLVPGCDFEAQGINGLATPLRRCESCDDPISDNASTFEGESYCADCFSEQFFECANCNRTNLIDESHTAGGETYCASCFDRFFTYCTDCDEAVDQDEILTDYAGDDVCPACFERSSFICPDCDETFSIEDKRHFEGDTVCPDCKEVSLAALAENVRAMAAAAAAAHQTLFRRADL